MIAELSKTMVRHLTSRSSGEYRHSSSERVIPYDEELVHDGEESFPLATWGTEGVDTDDEIDLLQFTQEEEQKVVRKLDRRLARFVALLYLLSFLDRSSMFLHHVATQRLSPSTSAADSRDQILATQKLLEWKLILELPMHNFISS